MEEGNHFRELEISGGQGNAQDESAMMRELVCTTCCLF